MNVKLILAVIIAFLIPLNLKAQDSTVVEDTLGAKKEYRKIEQSAFKTGEKFTFQINYGFG